MIATAFGRVMKVVNFVTEANDLIEAVWQGLPFKYRYDRLREEIGEKAYNAMLARRIKAEKAAETRGEVKLKNRQTNPLEKPTPQQMLKDIWDHWDKINWSDSGKDGKKKNVVDNIVKNEFEDRFYGQIGKTSARASRVIGKPVGIQTGPTF